MNSLPEFEATLTPIDSNEPKTDNVVPADKKLRWDDLVFEGELDATFE